MYSFAHTDIHTDTHTHEYAISLSKFSAGIVLFSVVVFSTLVQSHAQAHATQKQLALRHHWTLSRTPTLTT